MSKTKTVAPLAMTTVTDPGRIMDMVEFNGRLFVATESRVYQLEGEVLVPVMMMSEAAYLAHKQARIDAAMGVPADGPPDHEPPPCPAPPTPPRKKRAPAEPKSAAPARRPLIARGAGEGKTKAELVASAAEAVRAASAEYDLREVRTAERQGWRRITGRVPAGAQRRSFGGKQMWRQR